MKNLSERIKTNFNKVKETSRLTIILFIVLYCIEITFVNLVVFKSKIFSPIADLTFDLINVTLIVNLIDIFLFVFLIIIKFGRLDFADIGVKKNRLLSAVLAVFTIWATMQIINAATETIIYGSPTLYTGWKKNGVLFMIGQFVAQIFGNALLEEMVFRGFLFAQIAKKVSKYKLTTGLIVSQLIFALIHIPNRISNGMSAVDILPSLVILFLLGIFFAVIYMVTDNLFLAVGIHSLWNIPMLVFDGLVYWKVLLVLTLLVLVFWNKTFGRIGMGEKNVGAYGLETIEQ